jgi:hypothetical protein
MKARLQVHNESGFCRWWWELESIRAGGVLIESESSYVSKKSAERSARRWAKNHNIEIVKESE